MQAAREQRVLQVDADELRHLEKELRRGDARRHAGERGRDDAVPAGEGPRLMGVEHRRPLAAHRARQSGQ